MLSLNEPGLEGFKQSECDLVNQAVSVLIAQGFSESHAADIAINNWSLLGINTAESLTRTNCQPASAAEKQT